MIDRLGQHLGNYRLIHLLGSGGFADVYIGEHIYLKTQAAIKILHTKLTQEDLQRFLQEAQTIAHLRHPHIVRILEFGVEGIPFLAMDYAPNGTLRQRHPSGSIVPLASVVSYVKQIASALQYAHNERLIHRDVKPENMLLAVDNEVLLSDFGIAVVGHSTHYQSEHEVAGTAAYMAPEQLQGKPRRASDQYSLGVVVYEWLSGDRPFRGTFTEVASQHMFVPPPPLRSKVPSISPEVEQVVLRALAKDPQQRFANVQAFATALEQASQPKSAPVVTTSLVYTGHSDGVWSVAWNPVRGTGTLPGGQVMPDGFYIASAGDDRTVQVWDAAMGHRLLIYSGHSNWVHALAWSPDGRRIASASYDNTVQVWDAATGQLLLVCSGHTAGLNSVVWSTDGRFLASSSWDKTVRIWDAATGRNILTYKGHTDVVSPVAWSPDGRRIASAGSDKTVQVWDAMTGRLLLRYDDHSDCVDAVAWSPDGTRLASAGDDETVQVWDAMTRRLLLRYTGHSDWVWSVAWSPDGRRLASASRDKTVQVWDAASGYPLLHYTDHASSVNAVAWSPDGRRIASASKDRTVRVWQAG
jgi:eukaryotic-like serine/threonine-protein kinase